MDSETLDALRATWERDRAERILLRAKLDALVFTLTEELGLEYEAFMVKLRIATQVTSETALIREEDRDPAFAARVRAWIDQELPNFPLDQPPSGRTPPSTEGPDPDQ